MASAAPHPVLFHLDQARCRDLETAPEREWLETDGLGGYASSTVSFCPTRRYHGLLVGYPEGSSKRHVFLSRYEETLWQNDESTSISTARYADAYAPRGSEWLESFELAPHPVSVYRTPAIEVVREVLLVRHKGVVLNRYRVRGGEAGLELELRPFLPFREADALTVENDVIDQKVESVPGGIRSLPYKGLPAITITLGKAAFRFVREPLWYRGFEYAADRRRGYPSSEDQFSPGSLRIPLPARGEVIVAASVGAAVKNPATLWKKEEARRLALHDELAPTSTSPAHLRCTLAAEDFLYRSSAKRVGINAGYPWFVEWGRDTFIALPGLTLARGQVEACGEALRGTLEYLQDGLLPNVYGRTRADSHYGSADASLWYARAVQLYEKEVGTESIAREFLAPLTEIATAYAEGTGLAIECRDGLLHAGSDWLNATWMDAQTSAGPVTPRKGFPIEINALWYSLLQHLERLCGQRGDARSKKRWTALRREAKRSFLARFWIEDESRLADGWDEGVADTRIRPNMVIAAALEHSPLTRAQRAGVVACARKQLLSERGLRTLAPGDPDYAPRYEGGPEERDGAYHQGTVWPWLLGFYCEAHLRAHGSKKNERDALRALWTTLEGELDRAGLNHMSEVFDAEEPQRPGGTIAQAWNTAEYLRSMALLAKSRL